MVGIHVPYEGADYPALDNNQRVLHVLDQLRALGCVIHKDGIESATGFNFTADFPEGLDPTSIRTELFSVLQ